MAAPESDWDADRLGPRWSLIGGVVVVVVVLLLVGWVVLSDDSEEPEASAGQPVEMATASRMDGEIPVGFPQTEEGALAAIVAWWPRLITGPPELRPEGVESVLGDDAEDPGISRQLEDAPQWLAFDPLAVGEIRSEEGTVTIELAGTMTAARQAQDRVVFAVTSYLIDLRWDPEREDWVITDWSLGRVLDTPPLDYGDVAGLRRLWPTGVVIGEPLAPRSTG